MDAMTILLSVNEYSAFHMGKTKNNLIELPGIFSGYYGPYFMTSPADAKGVTSVPLGSPEGINRETGLIPGS